MGTGFIGFVCGLKSEAATLSAFNAHSQVQIGVSGANAQRARQEAERLAGLGARVLVSFGVSGGLSRDLAPGDLVLGRDVVEAGSSTRYQAALTLTHSVLARLEGNERAVAMGSVLGSDTLIDGPGMKKKLAKAHAALAVDMESHAVAQVAAERDVPLVVFRAIADPVTRALPQSAQHAVAPDGSIRPLDVLRASLARPAEIVDLIRLGTDSRAGHKALRGGARHLIPALLGIMHVG